jgi:predicted DNA binding CopG/RHH family protein
MLSMTSVREFGGDSKMKPTKEGKPDPLDRATMRLPQSLLDAVKHRAIDEHISLAELIARALAEYLKKGDGRER